MMEAEDILQESGLSGNEAKIYLALLKLGSSLVGKIADETRLNRTHVYDRLRHLLEKGTVSYVIQSGKKYFTAVNPTKLLESMHEKEARLQELLPSLFQMEKKNTAVEIEVYRGKEGLKTILQDYIKEKKDVFIMGFTGAVALELAYFYPHFQRKRAKLGIKRKILADARLRKNTLAKQPLTEVRFIPKGYQSPSGMWIYGDKVVIFIPGELYAILIKSMKTARFYKNYFDMVWNMSKS